jgi:hypothetical protein
MLAAGTPSVLIFSPRGGGTLISPAVGNFAGGSGGQIDPVGAAPPRRTYYLGPTLPPLLQSRSRALLSTVSAAPGTHLMTTLAKMRPAPPRDRRTLLA